MSGCARGRAISRHSLNVLNSADVPAGPSGPPDSGTVDCELKVIVTAVSERFPVRHRTYELRVPPTDATAEAASGVRFPSVRTTTDPRARPR